jgi:hypothetical protein
MLLLSIELAVWPRLNNEDIKGVVKPQQPRSFNLSYAAGAVGGSEGERSKPARMQ